jgi:hypothetical protein
MNQLDSFESALLAELRRHVAEQPVRVPARPRHRRRLVAIGATGVAASVVTVFGLGGTGGSPAYAVGTNADGDVVVTVHRLDDAAGLEQALAAKGIDADVSYDADGTQGPTSVGIGPDGELQVDQDPPPLPEGGTGTVTQEKRTGSLSSGGADDQGAVTQSSGTPPEDDPCGFDPTDAGASPADLSKNGSDWVLTIPAGSPLMDRHVTIGTDADGGLSVFYAGDQPGSFCGVAQATVHR